MINIKSQAVRQLNGVKGGEDGLESEKQSCFIEMMKKNLDCQYFFL